MQSEDLERREREALVGAGFLRRVVKGWYLVSRPGDERGDTTPWFAALRDFVAGYCTARFGNAWHVAPAYSILVQTGATVLPRQVIEVRGGLRVLALPVALTRVSEHFFHTSPTDAQIALAGIRDASDLNRELLAGGRSIVAGRVTGALRAVGRPALADDVVGSMRAAGYTVQEDNPFAMAPHTTRSPSKDIASPTR